MSTPSDFPPEQDGESSPVEPLLPEAAEPAGTVATTVAPPRAGQRPRRPAGASSPRPVSVLAEEPEDGFLQRNALVLFIAIATAAGVGYLVFKKPGTTTSAPVRQERVVMIAPLPPLPPPPLPPPPPQQKPPEEKMEKETAPVEEAKQAPKPEPVKAPSDPAPLGTGLKGDGPGLAGLGGGSGLGGGTLGGGGGAKSGSRFGWYAGQVQSRIADSLRKNPKTKNASLRLDVRIWPDTTGRITRAQLASSTGDRALDDTIQNGVLTGLQLQEPPPAGMRLPIVLRLVASRPN